MKFSQKMFPVVNGVERGYQPQVFINAYVLLYDVHLHISEIDVVFIGKAVEIDTPTDDSLRLLRQRQVRSLVLSTG